MTRQSIIDKIQSFLPQFDLCGFPDEDIICFDSPFIEGEFFRIEIDFSQDPVRYYYSRPFWDDDVLRWIYEENIFDNPDELIEFVKKG